MIRYIDKLSCGTYKNMNDFFMIFYKFSKFSDNCMTNLIQKQILGRFLNFIRRTQDQENFDEIKSYFYSDELSLMGKPNTGIKKKKKIIFKLNLNQFYSIQFIFIFILTIK
jgi:hypothetical protein